MHVIYVPFELEVKNEYAFYFPFVGSVATVWSRFTTELFLFFHSFKTLQVANSCSLVFARIDSGTIALVNGAFEFSYSTWNASKASVRFSRRSNWFHSLQLVYQCV